MIVENFGLRRNDGLFAEGAWQAYTGNIFSQKFFFNFENLSNFLRLLIQSNTPIIHDRQKDRHKRWNVE